METQEKKKFDYLAVYGRELLPKLCLEFKDRNPELIEISEAKSGEVYRLGIKPYNFRLIFNYTEEFYEFLIKNGFIQDVHDEEYIGSVLHLREPLPLHIESFYKIIASIS